MRKLADDDFREGFVGYKYPSNIDAKAFYGVIAETHRPNADDNFDEAIGLLADKINTPIKSFARVDWCLSTTIHKKMRQAVYDLIWDFSDEQNLDLAPEQVLMMKYF